LHSTVLLRHLAEVYYIRYSFAIRSAEDCQRLSSSRKSETIVIGEWASVGENNAAENLVCIGNRIGAPKRFSAITVPLITAARLYL
jgi:hypothetical protein